MSGISGCLKNCLGIALDVFLRGLEVFSEDFVRQSEEGLVLDGRDQYHATRAAEGRNPNDVPEGDETPGSVSSSMPVT